MTLSKFLAEFVKKNIALIVYSDDVAVFYLAMANPTLSLSMSNSV
jgi:hypothetical protein